MLILSINFNHDGAALLLRDGRIAAWVTTERRSRVKKHPGIREEDLSDLLDQAGASIQDVDFATLCNLRVEYPEVVERYGTDFKDTWIRFALDASRKQVTLRGRAIPCSTDHDHFLCHAAAAFYFSPFEEAVSFACDPLGSSAYLGRGTSLRRVALPSSQIGNVYAMVSRDLLGFGALYGAGKTMGLAPYGEHRDPEIARRLEAACAELSTHENPSLLVRTIDELSSQAPSWMEENGRRWNASAAFLAQAALESVWERLLVGLHQSVSRSGGGSGASQSLCLSGGTALNSVANEKCFSRSGFERLYLHPACGDDGTALGAALLHWHDGLGQPRLSHTNAEAMYSVRSYGRDSVDAALRAHSSGLRVERTGASSERAAELVAGGKIVGWFDGAGEIGPRALGHRSIVCDPRAADMKARLNSKVKYREAFRPFAPSVLREAASEWFGVADSPFMLRVAPVLKDGVPAITHHDGTARIQTVARDDNPAYYRLIEAFAERTGVPMVLNTSFNIKAEPIVETPRDALATFLGSGMDAVVFPDVVVTKDG